MITTPTRGGPAADVLFVVPHLKLRHCCSSSRLRVGAPLAVNRDGYVSAAVWATSLLALSWSSSRMRRIPASLREERRMSAKWCRCTGCCRGCSRSPSGTCWAARRGTRATPMPAATSGKLHGEVGGLGDHGGLEAGGATGALNHLGAGQLSVRYHPVAPGLLL